MKHKKLTMIVALVLVVALAAGLEIGRASCRERV